MPFAAPVDLRVLLIRHAEKPVPGEAEGVDEHGHASEESLTPRGWQRAGALVGLFGPGGGFVPDIVYATGVGPGSTSLRSVQTATPVAQARGVPLVTRYLKDELDALCADVLGRRGCVLVVWEHKRMAELARRLTGGAAALPPWPRDCFDRMWILEREAGGWTHRVLPQRLLPGDER